MNILITGALQKAEEMIHQLALSGHQVRYMQHEDEPLPCEYEWVEGTICNSLFQAHPIELFRNLRFIQLTSAGFDRVPMAYVAEHNIEIHNARGVYSIPMAEFAVCGVLQLYKQAAFFRENQRLHQWVKHRGLTELNGKTVCIVGCGSVGTECAKRFRAFGCRVTGVDPVLQAGEPYETIYPVNEIDVVLGTADIVVLALPLTDETRGMMDANRLAGMKAGSILVNIARGPIVDEKALTEALLNVKIGGAVLDVFETEPLTESKLWDMDNVLVTPHNSFVSENNQERLQQIVLEHLGK